MWKNIKLFYKNVWEQTTWKGKVSMLLGLIVGIILGSYFVHEELAKRGCNVSAEWGYLLFSGFFGILAIFTGLTIAGFLIRVLLEIPDYIEEKCKTADKRRAEKAVLKELKEERKQHLGYKYINPNTFKYVCWWIVKVLSILFTIFIVSVTAGYIWWSIFC